MIQVNNQGLGVAYEWAYKQYNSSTTIDESKTYLLCQPKNKC